MNAASRKTGARKRLSYPFVLGLPYMFSRAGVRKNIGVFPSNPPSLWLPFQDAGNGVADIREFVRGATMTFSRANQGGGYTRLSNGLFAVVPDNTARAYYGANGKYLGVLLEGNAVNLVLWNRDLSNAAWTKSNTTAAKDAVGITGDANSCSTLTATADNGTVLQSLTHSSSAKAFCVWIKRKTGTGTVSLTLDNGAAWTDVTAQVSAGSWARIEIYQTLANSIVGIKLGTSGDAIYVDFAQHQGSFCDSPVYSEGTAGTRDHDKLYTPIGSWFNTSEGTVFTRVVKPWAGTTGGQQWAFNDETNNNSIRSTLSGVPPNGQATFRVTSGGVAQVDSGFYTQIMVQESTYKYSAAWKANDFATYFAPADSDGTIDNAVDSAGTIPTGLTYLFLGRAGTVAGTLNPLYAALREFRYYNTRIPDTALRALIA